MIHGAAWLLASACGQAPAPQPDPQPGATASPQPAAPASTQPASAQLAGPALRSDLLYFVLLDRFADGRPDAPGTTDRTDPQAWHGGDVPGLQSKLDHLSALGAGTVWVSPLMQSRQAKLGEWGAYHGYWVEDHAQPEPRFTTLDELTALSDALHAQRMRLYLDMVYNHVGYDAPLTALKPEWFHHHGDIRDWNDPEQVVTYDVHGLPDFAQERTEVMAYLRDASAHWLRTAHADGLRIDAVRHLNPGFLAQLQPDLKRTGGEGFGLLGEVLDGQPGALAGRMAQDELDAVFDFPLAFAWRDALCQGKPMGKIAAVYGQDARYGRPIRPGPTGISPLVTLLDNHDLPRLASLCTSPETQALALAALFSSRGTPSLTYGTEIGLNGAKEPENRADMRWDADSLAHPAHALIQQLNHTRARWPALREGDTQLDRLSPGLLQLTRLTDNEAVHVILATEAQPTLQLPQALNDARLVEVLLVTGGQATQRDAQPKGKQAIPARLDANSALLLRYAPAEPGGFAALRSPPTVALVINAAEVSVPSGGTLRLVGAGEQLGDWDPSQAPSFGPDGRLALSLPLGAAITGKLVLLDRAGKATWEDREQDRTLLIGAPDCGRDCAPVRDGRAAVRWFWAR